MSDCVPPRTSGLEAIKKAASSHQLCVLKGSVLKELFSTFTNVIMRLNFIFLCLLFFRPSNIFYKDYKAYYKNQSEYHRNDCIFTKTCNHIGKT